MLIDAQKPHVDQIAEAEKAEEAAREAREELAKSQSALADTNAAVSQMTPKRMASIFTQPKTARTVRAPALHPGAVARHDVGTFVKVSVGTKNPRRLECLRIVRLARPYSLLR